MPKVSQKFMRLRLDCFLPLASNDTEAMLEGAKRNRALVIAMNKLGYCDVQMNMWIAGRRVDTVIPLPALPTQGALEDAIAEAVGQAAEDGAAAMARKLR